MSIEILAVNKNNPFSYYIKGSNETEAELIQRINVAISEDIQRLEKTISERPESNADGFFTKRLEEVKNADYQLMTYDEYLQLMRKKYIDDATIKEVTEEDFDYALDVLPPLHWCKIDGIEMFCMSEATWGTYTTQYARTPDGKYYCTTVDSTDRSTWINNRI